MVQIKFTIRHISHKKQAVKLENINSYSELIFGYN